MKTNIAKESNHKFIDIFDELIFHFGACCVKSLVDGANGLVRQANKESVINCVKYWVICEDKPEHIGFLALLKGRLMERFEQEEILMYYTTVNRF